MIGPGRKQNPAIAPGGASGQMLYWNETTQRYEFTEITELFWDAADKELGIGTSTPDEPLVIQRDFDGNIGVRLKNENGGTKAVARYIVDMDGGSAFLAGYGSGFTQSGAKIPNSAALISNLSMVNGLSFVSRSTTAPMRFYVGGNTDSDLQAIIDVLGNLELKSKTGTLIVARVTTAEKNAITAVNGMILYDTDLNKFQGRENGAWVNLI